LTFGHLATSVVGHNQSFSFPRYYLICDHRTQAQWRGSIVDKLNQWLALIGNIGVIAGVLFVGWEIQQNTEQMQAEIAHGVMASLRDAMEPLTEGSNADMYMRGLPGLENLSDAEKFQFNSISARFFRVFEEAYLHYHLGRLEEGYWQSITGQLQMVLRIPGIRENWYQTGDNYNDDFKQWGDSLITE
jgi:hypothetical protein